NWQVINMRNLSVYDSNLIRFLSLHEIFKHGNDFETWVEFNVGCKEKLRSRLKSSDIPGHVDRVRNAVQFSKRKSLSVCCNKERQGIIVRCIARELSIIRHHGVGKSDVSERRPIKGIIDDVPGNSAGDTRISTFSKKVD